MGKALERAALILPRGYLHGLTLSTAGSSATFSVALGEAVDDSFTSLMTTAGLSKTTSAWAVGTATGSLDTGTIAVSTWYHVYLIKRPDTGVVDVLTSLSATAPTMPTNYTLKRRIGSMKTNGSSQWTKFVQDGDLFQWDVPVQDVAAANPGTAAVTRTLTVPTGVRILAKLYVGAVSTSAATGPAGILISDLSTADTAPAIATAANTGSYSNAADMQTAGTIDVYTNTSAQVRSRIQLSAASVTLYMVSMGWIDTRGKLF